MTLQTERAGGLRFRGGVSRVYHCNHYNAYLQMVVLLSEGIPGCAPRELLRHAAIPIVGRMGANGASPEALIDEFSYAGFGVLHPSDDGVSWTTPCSHYSQTAYSYGQPEPSCFFTAGYLEGLTERPVEETACQRVGASEDCFAVRGGAQPGIPGMTAEDGSPLTRFYRSEPALSDVPDADPALASPFDERELIAAVDGLGLHGSPAPGGNGLIDAFGVNLTDHFADYYNAISYITYRHLLDAGIPAEDAKEQFIQAGHICAFFTLGGIMESPEWHAAVQPHCRSREDWLHGIVAITNALGWGTWRIESLDPGRAITFRIYNSYEGIGYRRLFGPSDDPALSFLGMGAGLGMAHLLWKIDIRERPRLDKSYYVDVFNQVDAHHFSVEQTHGIAAGDPYDRIRVTRA